MDEIQENSGAPEEQTRTEEQEILPVTEAAESDAPSADAAPLEARIDELSSKMDHLASVFSDRMMSSEVLAHFESNMKSQMADIRVSAVRSLLVKIASVRETAADMLGRMQSGRDTMTVDDAIDAVESFGDMLEEILVMNGAVRFRDEAGTAYEYPRHNKIKIIDTDDPDLNKTIADVVSSGYILDDKVLIPEKVKVYRCIGKPE